MVITAWQLFELVFPFGLIIIGTGRLGFCCWARNKENRMRGNGGRFQELVIAGWGIMDWRDWSGPRVVLFMLGNSHRNDSGLYADIKIVIFIHQEAELSLWFIAVKLIMSIDHE